MGYGSLYACGCSSIQLNTACDWAQKWAQFSDPIFLSESSRLSDESLTALPFLWTAFAALLVWKMASQIPTSSYGCIPPDPSRLGRAAHALKGSVGTFQASAAQEAANQVEIYAKDADLVGARKAFETLSIQIDLVRQDLRQLARARAADDHDVM